jgi:hypothetical protein
MYIVSLHVLHISPVLTSPSNIWEIYHYYFRQLYYFRDYMFTLYFVRKEFCCTLHMNMRNRPDNTMSKEQTDS